MFAHKFHGDDDMMNDNDESVALVQLSGSIVDEPAAITSPSPSNNTSATSSASASASEDNSETIPNDDDAHLSDQMELLGIDQNTIVQGNQPFLPELIDFCRSESLTEQGLRDRLSHLEYQRGDSTYDVLLLFICANDRVTYGMVKYFLQRFPSSASSVAFLSPLHVLCQNNYATLDIVRCVIESNPGALLTQDKDGRTPLIYLCFNEELDDAVSVEILTLLLITSPECAQCCMNGGLSLLLPNILISCEYRSPKFCCLLIEACLDSILHQVEGIQCLNHVLFSPKVDDSVALTVLKLLLHKWHDDVHRLRINDCPFLHKAASANISRAAEICRLLVQVLPELLFEHDENGHQPLHIACANGNLPVVECILEIFPDAILAQSDRGFYPIHFAVGALAKCPNAAVNAAEYLLQVYPSVASQRSICFPLFLAGIATKESNLITGLKMIKSLYDAYPEAIVTAEQSFRLAVDESLFVDAVRGFFIKQLDYAAQASDLQLVITRDEDGLLPLHKALLDVAPLGSIKLLAQADPATLQIPDSSGSLPLHIACKRCDPIVVKYLVDLDMRSLLVADHNGDTPLHCACLAANYDVIELLLAQYPAAPVGERNVNGELPIQILLEHDEPENGGYMSSMFLLLRANPEMWMNDMNLMLALAADL